MHVLSVIHYPVFGGPHNRNSKIIPELIKQDIETSVLLPDDDGNAADLLHKFGIKVIKMPLVRLRATRNVFIQIKTFLFFFRDVFKIYNLIKREKIDVIQINGFVNLQAAFAGKIANIPVVLQIIDTYTPKIARKILMPMVKRTSSILMCTGEKVANLHEGANFFEERLIYFYPPVNLSLFKKDDNRRQFARNHFGFSDNDVVVGTVGNINMQKGHDLFLQAAALLKKRGKHHFKFVLLGAKHNNHKKFIRKLYHFAENNGLKINDDIIFFDPGTDVYKYEPAFDLFWMTSKPDSEGIPTSIEEAMALGLPVISTDVGSISEIVQDGVTGFLVSSNRQAQQIVDKSLLILAENILYERFSEKAVLFAKKNFSIANCAKKHILAYEKALTLNDIIS